MTVVPLVIGPEVRDRWLASVWAERPERDLQRELKVQDEALEAIAHVTTDTFVPSRESKHTDLDLYFKKVRPLIMPDTQAIERI